MAAPGRVLILGAGPTGLGAASRCEELGFDDYLVLEARQEPGGLASSYRDEHGFTWDVGGHVQFSHYAAYDAVLDRALGDRWLWHERESWIWVRGRFVPYPFQLNLHRLDPPDRDAAVRGLERAAARREPPPATFAEWIHGTFGDELADLFMVPYNRKVWGYPLETLSADWMGDRVAPPDLDRVRRNIAEARDDVSWGPNNRFRFPLEGGTGAIWKAVAARLPPERLRFGQQVEGIDLARRTVTLGTGETHRFQTLISSLPLDRLIAIAGDVPPPVRDAAARLVYSSVYVIGVGLEGSKPDELRRKCWMYFPEPSSPYYRVTVFSNYSPRNVPAGDCWSLMAEVCDTRHAGVDGRGLKTRVLDAMQRDGLVPRGAKVVSFWQHREERGYPTPFLGRDEVLRTIAAELESRGVYSRGRFGAWKYEVSNQDHSFMQGVELVDRLLRGTPETTVVNPSLANSGVFLRAAHA